MTLLLWPRSEWEETVVMSSWGASADISLAWTTQSWAFSWARSDSLVGSKSSISSWSTGGGSIVLDVR